jgi:hypothetical protein
MNTGLQDAANLAWKLASVLGGHAPAELLESYEKERRPIAEWVLNTSDKMFQGVTTQRSQVFSAIRRMFLGTLLAIVPEGSLPPKFLFNKISGLGITYKADGTCAALGDLTKSSYIKGGDRLSDALCLENTPQGPREVYTLQLLNSTPHAALRLILVANVSKALPSREEIEDVLSVFKSVTQKSVPIQPVLYMSHAAISGSFGGASSTHKLLSQPYAIDVDAGALKGFEECRMLTCIESNDAKSTSGDLVTTMGLRAGGRGLLVVRPDGYIAASHVDAAGSGKGWDAELVIDALCHLNYIKHVASA